jgi:hypothetical protein
VVEAQFLQPAKLLNENDLLIGAALVEANIGDVTEIVNPDKIREPARRPGFRKNSLSVVADRFPVVRGQTTGPRYRQHGVALSMRGMDEPTEPNGDDNHKHEQPANAESQVAAPELGEAIKLSGHTRISGVCR